MTEAEVTRAVCSACGRTTVHALLATHAVQDVGEPVRPDDYPAIWTDTYDMLECRGCQSVRLRHTSQDPSGSEDVHFYPPPASRPLPPWLLHAGPLHEGIQPLLREIYSALHNDSRRLAAMGARAVLDLVLEERVGGTGTFAQRLEMLEATGAISRTSREFLAVALDAGSAAAHRGYCPSTEDLRRMMDILENTVHALYVLGGDAADLKRSTPPRNQNPQKRSNEP